MARKKGLSKIALVLLVGVLTAIPTSTFLSLSSLSTRAHTQLKTQKKKEREAN